MYLLQSVSLSFSISLLILIANSTFTLDYECFEKKIKTVGNLYKSIGFWRKTHQFAVYSTFQNVVIADSSSTTGANWRSAANNIR